MANIPDWAKPPGSHSVPSAPHARSDRGDTGSVYSRRRSSGYGDRGRSSRGSWHGSTHGHGTNEGGRSRSTRDRRRSRREWSPEAPRRKNPTSGYGESDFRRHLQEKRHRREDTSRREPIADRSAEGPTAGIVPVSLGKTAGLQAVGAWAARVEIANILEARADPLSVVKAIKEGVGGEVLLDPGPPASSVKEGRGVKAGTEFDKDKISQPTPKTFQADESAKLASLFGSSKAEQQALLEGVGAFSSMPDWAEGSPTSSIFFKKRATVPRNLDHSLISKHSVNFLPPLEALQPPQVENFSPDVLSESQESEVEQVDQEVEDPEDGEVEFKKKARQPTQAELVPVEQKVKPPPKPQHERPADERVKLEKFYERAMELFEVLVVAGVKMELVDLIVSGESGDPSIDVDRFRLHVEPKGAGTGMGYVRLMERLVKFHEDYVERNEEEITPVSRATILAFTEYLIAEEPGFKTPKALLYALDFFSVSYGFSIDPGVMSRCRKLSETYASKKPPRKGADFFHPEMLEYLEAVVLDCSRQIGDRLVAGRLRLCCQASVRHSDLTRTPLRDVEWCRTLGSTEVRGIRAKVNKTKSGPRPWVASHLGVTPKGDGWMSALLELLISAHGSSWRTHDFFGVRFLSDFSVIPEPPSIGGDVTHLKRLLSGDIETGVHVPMTHEKIERLRFHGCKSTMTTIMQHFGVKSRVVRHAGAWAKQADSMPDLYLRESQLLVLQAQEECLGRLRGGETISALEGISLSEEMPKYSNGEAPGGVNPTRVPGDAMALPMLNSKELLSDFRDDADHTEEILDEEKKITIDQESVQSLLSEGLTSSETEDDEDYEMEARFLAANTGRGKIHKVRGDEEDTPKCGVAAKSLQVILAIEPLAGTDSLCKRCFGPLLDDGCHLMCTHRETWSDGSTRRCSRRCALGCERRADLLDNREHLCYMHSKSS